MLLASHDNMVLVHGETVNLVYRFVSIILINNLSQTVCALYYFVIRAHCCEQSRTVIGCCWMKSIWLQQRPSTVCTPCSSPLTMPKSCFLNRIGLYSQGSISSFVVAVQLLKLLWQLCTLCQKSVSAITTYQSNICFSTEPTAVHSNFRLFACMNPATDVGKRNLPTGIRNRWLRLRFVLHVLLIFCNKLRFTELFVDELQDEQELVELSQHYLNAANASAALVHSVVAFYVTIKQQTLSSDAFGNSAHYRWCS